jgi:hypothetical protein
MQKNSPGQLSQDQQLAAAVNAAEPHITKVSVSRQRDADAEQGFKDAIAAVIPPGSRAELILYNNRPRLVWYSGKTVKQPTPPEHDPGFPF